VFSYVDYVTPNETELQAHTGMPADSDDEILAASRELIKRGAKNVIAKAGKRGAYLVDKDDFIHIEGYKVKAVDTTAAGDSFNAGFAYAISEGMDIKEAIRFANAVGGLSTTAMGAQSAMPTIDEVNEFISKNK
jgi:ribokinase